MKEYYKAPPEIYVVSTEKDKFGHYKTIENHERRYFNTVEELKDYYARQSQDGLYRVWQNRIGYYGIIHNGGHWGFGSTVKCSM